MKHRKDVPEKTNSKIKECSKTTNFNIIKINEEGNSFTLINSIKKKSHPTIEYIRNKDLKKTSNKELYSELNVKTGVNISDLDLIQYIFYIYSLTRNDLIGGVKKNIENLIVIDPKHFIFKNKVILEDKERELVFEKIKEVFSFLREKISEEYFYVLATYYSNLLPDKMKKDFDNEFDVDFSKQQIRERIDSPLFGLRAPGAWMPLMVKRASAKEMREYIKKIFSIYSRNIDKVFWLSEFYVDSNKDVREKYNQLFLQFVKKKDVYSAELINSLITNDRFLGMIEDHKKEIPNFRSRRQSLINQLESEPMKDYIVYELISLGDMNLSYFDFLR